MIADLCVFGIVVLFIALGYKAGFIRSCVNVAALGISIGVSLVVYPVISTLVMQSAIYDGLVNFLKANFSADVTNGISNGAMKMFSGVINENTAILAGGIFGGIATLIVNIATFVVVMVLCRLVLFVMTHIFDLFAKLPVIKQFNRLGGSILGGVLGVTVVYLLLAVSLTVLPMDSTGAVANEIANSKVASQLYNNNILLYIVN